MDIKVTFSGPHEDAETREKWAKMMSEWAEQTRNQSVERIITELAKLPTDQIIKIRNALWEEIAARTIKPTWDMWLGK